MLVAAIGADVGLPEAGNAAACTDTRGCSRLAAFMGAMLGSGAVAEANGAFAVLSSSRAGESGSGASRPGGNGQVRLYASSSILRSCLDLFLNWFLASSFQLSFLVTQCQLIAIS